MRPLRSPTGLASPYLSYPGTSARAGTSHVVVKEVHVSQEPAVQESTGTARIQVAGLDYEIVVDSGQDLGTVVTAIRTAVDEGTSATVLVLDGQGRQVQMIVNGRVVPVVVIDTRLGPPKGEKSG